MLNASNIQQLAVSQPALSFAQQFLVCWFATGGVPEGRQHLLPQERQISGYNGAEYAETQIFTNALHLSPLLSLHCLT